jgi:hypothetical protein
MQNRLLFQIMMDNENKKKKPSSYEDFMKAHENLVNDKKVAFISSLKKNPLDFKYANKYESLKLSILNRIKKNFQNI